jgi:hypothetical protein
MARDIGPLPWEFSAEVYRAAASEHLPAATELYERGRYVLASYAAGLAVESILRAYQFRRDPKFDARHDLTLLYRSSKFEVILPQSQAYEYGELLGGVVARWNNSHRFRSRDAYARWLKRLKLDRGIKGDYVKENTRRLLHGATQLVTVGLKKWQA